MSKFLSVLLILLQKMKNLKLTHRTHYLTLFMKKKQHIGWEESRTVVHGMKPGSSQRQPERDMVHA